MYVETSVARGLQYLATPSDTVVIEGRKAREIQQVESWNNELHRLCILADNFL